jgi:tRNA (cmo5U34)-methyltransferase
MKKDHLFRQSNTQIGDFEFNEEVAEIFDDMLLRSVPMYAEQQQMVKNIVERLWIPGTTVYDLGCSTATTLIELCRVLPKSARFIGYDSSQAMIDRANRNLRANRFDNRIELRQADLNGQPSRYPLDNASVVTMCWTLQFVRPLRRDNVIRWIYDCLADGGILIVNEKILTNDCQMNRLFIDFYYDFKRRQGYSEIEISRKREALENVLIPYRVEENLDLFRRNGFQIVDTFFQWFNFAGFLCIKKPALSDRASSEKKPSAGRRIRRSR